MSTLQNAFRKITEGYHLSADEAANVMGAIMDGEATHAQIGFLLGLLRMKGETAEEIAGFAQAMRERVVPVATRRTSVVDTCGTGGDRLKTFNLSTAAAFVAAAAGIPVAKHGNRAITSRCGSADVLEALGARLDHTPEQVGAMIDDIGIGFLFAPRHHPAMKHAVEPRREIGVRTFFNLLGPMTNPAGARRQVIGVYDGQLTRLTAEVLHQLGCERALIVYGLDGLDEFSPLGPTQASCVDAGKIQEQLWEPEDLGVLRVTYEEIRSADTPAANAEMLRCALHPDESAIQTAIIPNAAAAIWASGQCDSLPEAAAVARDTLRSGAAAAKLDEFIRRSGQSVPAAESRTK